MNATSNPNWAADQDKPNPPRLLDRLRACLARRRFSEARIERFVDWSRRFILFHGKRHPETMAEAEVEQFVERLKDQGSARKEQQEALAALGFLYREVLGKPLLWANVPRTRSAAAEMPGNDQQKPARLLDEVRGALRVRGYALRTEESYVNWIRRYIVFHNKRHPLELGGAHIEQFLTDLAVRGNVSASTQTQALSALLFLYQQVFEVELPLIRAVRSQRPRRLPVVLTRPEVRQVLEAIDGYEGVYRLMARLLYGSGLRLLECCRLRIKDVDFGRGQILVRQGKGDKDRVVMLPQALRVELEKQISQRREIHARDLARGSAFVVLPDALARKFPNAARELGWQYVFASRQLSRDPRSGNVGRHHVHESGVQGAVTGAARRLGMSRRISCHTFRHSFATHLLERGVDIRTVHDHASWYSL